MYIIFVYIIKTQCRIDNCLMKRTDVIVTYSLITDGYDLTLECVLIAGVIRQKMCRTPQADQYMNRNLAVVALIAPRGSI